MEEMQQITIDQWMSWKEDIREKLRETAGNFVYIGYRLKQIRDSGMYGGARDVFEFAFKEYGLSKSTVSRFIAINEKFSEGGNSLELKEEYRAIGSSKLAEMLTLTDAECSLITEKTTVAQIRELKSFSRQQEPEEEKEGPDGGQGSEDVREKQEWTPLQKCIIEYFRGKKEMLDAAMECIARGDYREASEAINPAGNATCRKGLVFLFMNEYKDGVKYKVFGSDDITAMAWDDFIIEICGIFWGYYSMKINGYDAIYGDPEKEKEKEPGKTEETAKRRNGEGPVATSQQEEKEEEEHVEEMEEEAEPEGSAEEGDDTPEGSADETEPGDDEDGTGGENDQPVEADREEPDTVYMGECTSEDIVTGIPQMTGGEPEERQYEEAYLEIEYLLKDMKDLYVCKKWDELIKCAGKVIKNTEIVKEQEGGQCQ